MEASTLPDRGALREPFPRWFGPAIFAYLAWTWWQVSKSQMVAGMPAGLGPAPEVGATLALMARTAGWLLESGYYSLWWRGRGKTLPFWRYFQWTAAISMVDLLAEALRHGLPDDGAPWRTWLVGSRAQPGMADSWEVAFGGVGLLVAVRLAMVIRVQREALAPIGWGPAFFVAATWLAGRVAAAWTYDLMRGSPLR